MATEVLPSGTARAQFARIINEIAADPEVTFEIGRHRKREVVVLSAERYDALVERVSSLRDLAWAAFAQDRIENPGGEPVTWEEAQSRRRDRRRD